MRGETLDEFQKTRNAQVLYSVGGNEVQDKLEKAGERHPGSWLEYIAKDILENGEHSAYLDWFEVTEIRGHIVDGDVGHFQVTMKIGFKMEG